MKHKKTKLFSPKNVLIVMSIIIATLIAVTLFTQWLQLMNQYEPDTTQYEVLQRFDIDQEISIPTWYSQSAILLSAALAIYIGLKLRRKSKGMDSSKWLALGSVLLFMSMDEGASLHELFVRPMREMTNITEGPLAAYWVIPVMLIALLVALYFLPFVLRLPKKTKILIILSGFTFVAGSVGMEMFDRGLYTYFVNQGVDPLPPFSIITRSIEEGMEMLGIAILVYALLDYIDSTKIRKLR